MLMKPDKKKSMASLIIGASAPPMDQMKSANEELTEKPEMDHGLLSAAEEMMSALESKDVQAFAEALQSFMSMADNDVPAEPQE
jgi:hypothetical protein